MGMKTLIREGGVLRLLDKSASLHLLIKGDLVQHSFVGRPMFSHLSVSPVECESQLVVGEPLWFRLASRKSSVGGLWVLAEEWHWAICAASVSDESKRGNPTPLLGGHKPNSFSRSCEGLTHGMFYSFECS